MNGLLPRAEVLARDLRGAVDRGEVSVLFQPEFSVESGRIVAVEALARWEHPELGEIPPGEFIAIAEASGEIAPLGIGVMHLACEAADDWQAAGFEVEVAINVSPVQLRSDDFVDALWDCIRSRSLAARRFVLELTETAPIGDIMLVAAQLRNVVDLGMGVAIDDFGAGNWSADQVRALPATELKIDRELIQGRTAEAVAALRSAVDFARELALRTVAEGVETAAQLRRVSEHGFDRVQGFLLASPLSRAEVTRMIAAQ